MGSPLLSIKKRLFRLPLSAKGKEVIEALSGRWIVEASELTGMRKADVEHLKSSASRRIDRARLSYERLRDRTAAAMHHRRDDNSKHYLRDLTGNRRFWPAISFGPRRHMSRPKAAAFGFLRNCGGRPMHNKSSAL